jgi:hypothetical protein
MAVPNIIVTLGGTNYPIPQPGSTPWGQNVTNWIVAASGGTGFLQAIGTTPFTFLKSATTNPAAAGALRLANTDTIDWRNFGNTADDKLFPGVAANSQSTDDLYWLNATAGVTTQLTGNPFANYKQGTAQVAFGPAATVIKFDTVITDTDTAYATGTGLFTVPTNKGGVYQLSAKVQLIQNTAAGFPTIYIYKNGAAIEQVASPYQFAAAGAGGMQVSSQGVSCVPTDTLGIYCSSTAGTLTTVIGVGSVLSIKRVS